MADEIVDKTDEVADKETDATEEKTEQLVVDVKQLQRDLEAERKLRVEAQEGQKFWFDKRVREHAPKDEPKDAEDDYDDIDLAKTVVDGDIKKFDATLKRLGYVKAGEVDGKINTKASELGTLNKYTTRYPDLNDMDSEMFKAVVEEADAIAEDPAFKRLPQAKRAELAIKNVELAWLQSGKLTVNGKNGDGKADAEAERQAKIKAQAPGGGRKPAQTEAPAWTAEMDKICRRMGISKEEYIKHQPTVKMFR